MTRPTTYGTGLVVGKFAPLHLGHQFVIDTALEQCDHVVIASWSIPEFSGCEPERRRGWLAELYPQTTRLVVDNAWLADWTCTTGQPTPPLPTNDDPDVDHRRFVGWLCTHVLNRTVDVVFTSEEYGPGFAIELEQWFAEHDQRTSVAHVAVDRDRAKMPISGTLIRDMSPSDRTQWLSPVVASSFVRRVTMLGGESSGKSTLTQAVAGALGTTHVAEYGRELWEQQDGVLAYDDLLRIAREQVRRETQATRTAQALTTGVVVCDTSPLTTLLYCLDMFGRAEPELEELAARPYDLTVLCRPDFDFVQDGTRRDNSFRMTQHAWYERELHERGIAYLEAVGSIAGRVAAVAESIRASAV